MDFRFIGHHYETVTPTMSVFTPPRLTAIIKSFLSSLLLLLADSMRHSSSAPVCSCYCTLLPFLLAPEFYSSRLLFFLFSFFFLFLCCSCVTGSRAESALLSSLIQSNRGPLLSSLMLAASIHHTSSKMFHTS